MSAQSDAQKIVDDFAALASCPTAWSFMDRAKVAAGLKIRIKDPDKINQSDTSLCGPADFIRDIAQDKPDQYAKAVVDLYKDGKAAIGSFKIKASSDLRKHSLAKSTIDQSDWIILASIRDTDNWWFDYQSESDDVAAITMPHSKETWLRKAGYTDIVNDTNILLCKDNDNAVRANDLRGRGYKVALFINANMLDVKTMDKASTTPDHWVALTSSISRNQATPIDVETLSFTVYSWGAQMAVPKSGRLSRNSFLANYYGFIACRR
jgi:hypothetical protein